MSQKFYIINLIRDKLDRKVFTDKLERYTMSRGSYYQKVYAFVFTKQVDIAINAFILKFGRMPSTSEQKEEEIEHCVNITKHFTYLFLASEDPHENLHGLRGDILEVQKLIRDFEKKDINP